MGAYEKSKSLIKIIFVLVIASNAVIQARPPVRDFKFPYNVHESANLKMTVEGVPVKIQLYKDIQYAQFYTQEPLPFTVKIKAEEKIKNVTISPKRLNIEPEIENKTLSFKLAESQKLVVKINDHMRFFIFPEPFIMYKLGVGKNILDYGVDNTGSEIQTQKIQNAIDQLPEGTRLYFPPGIYLTGTLKLKSNMSLHLLEGAVIKGSANPADYPVDEGFSEPDTRYPGWSNSGKGMTFSRLIFIDGCENVSIWGNGIIDGTGLALRVQGKPSNLIRIRNSKDIRIKNVTLRDPAAWNTHILHSENIRIENVKILNDMHTPNADGINPDGSKNVLLENNFLYCSDDCFAIKSTGNSGLLQNCENITVKDNIMLTEKSALKVGTETYSDEIKNITFKNNDILLCDRGMSLYIHDGTRLSYVNFIGNHFEDHVYDNRQRMVDFGIRKRNPNSDIGSISDILVKDCKFYKKWPKPSTIKGFDDQHPVKNVTFENFRIGNKKCENLKDANITDIKKTENIAFE